jgi:hypothetical protein
MTLGLMPCVVYWLFDTACVCPWKHGYIGVTVNLRNRLKWHRAKQERIFEYRILFEGTEQECYALEAAMRPEAFIGWNMALGGEGGSRQPRSPETRQRMREAALRRYADPAERAKMSAVQMGRTVAWGAKIAAGRLGLKPSDATRAKMSATRKGRPAPPRTPEHCANIAAAKKGMKMPWIAESNRRRARGKMAVQL